AALQALIVLGPPAPPPAQPPPSTQATNAYLDLKKRLDTRLTHLASKSTSDVEQSWAHVAIMRHGKVDDQRVEQVGKRLSYDDLEVRCMAAQALGVIGKEAKSQLPHLLTLLRAKEEDAAASAMLALGAMGGDAMPAVAPIEALKKGYAEKVKQDPRYGVLISVADQAIDAIKNPKNQPPKKDKKTK